MLSDEFLSYPSASRWSLVLNFCFHWLLFAISECCRWRQLSCLWHPACCNQFRSWLVHLLPITTVWNSDSWFLLAYYQWGSSSACWCCQPFVLILSSYWSRGEDSSLEPSQKGLTCCCLVETTTPSDPNCLTSYQAASTLPLCLERANLVWFEPAAVMWYIFWKHSEQNQRSLRALGHFCQRHLALGWMKTEFGLATFIGFLGG